jgi:hypothetical protein
MVKIGKSRNPRYVLKATSSPMERRPPITCKPPKSTIRSVPRFASKKTNGKLLENVRTVSRFFPRSSSFTER